MISTSYGIGTVTAGDGAVVMSPKFLPSSPKPGVLHAHGAGGYSQNMIDPTGLQSSLYGAIGDSGRVLLSSDYGGPANWGASTAMTRMSAANTYLHTLPGVKAGKVALIGGSMGALCALNWAAANPTLVSCVVGVIPVVNLTDIVGNNRGGYAAEVIAAYGGSYSEAANGPTSNPKTNAATKYAGIPILLYYGTSDTLCLPSEVTGFAAAAGSNVTMRALEGGHDYGTWANVNRDEVVAFLNQYAV